ncbi:MAG: thioredoxin family protein [Akkermansiaceae bacterium]
MKAIKQFITTIFSFAILAGSTYAGEWMTDIDSAVAKAKMEKKAVLVEFTGSDWCPPCMQMDKEVFSKDAFVDEASKKYILVKIDIPQNDRALYEANQKVLAKYKVEGVPTVLLLNEKGKEFDRFVATAHPSVKSFLAHLNKELMDKDNS